MSKLEFADPTSPLPKILETPTVSSKFTLDSTQETGSLRLEVKSPKTPGVISPHKIERIDTPSPESLPRLPATPVPALRIPPAPASTPTGNPPSRGVPYHSARKKKKAVRPSPETFGIGHLQQMEVGGKLVFQSGEDLSEIEEDVFEKSGGDTTVSISESAPLTSTSRNLNFEGGSDDTNTTRRQEKNDRFVEAARQHLTASDKAYLRKNPEAVKAAFKAVGKQLPAEQAISHMSSEEQRQLQEIEKMTVGMEDTQRQEELDRILQEKEEARDAPIPEEPVPMEDVYSSPPGSPAEKTRSQLVEEYHEAKDEYAELVTEAEPDVHQALRGGQDIQAQYTSDVGDIHADDPVPRVSRGSLAAARERAPPQRPPERRRRRDPSVPAHAEIPETPMFTRAVQSVSEEGTAEETPGGDVLGGAQQAPAPRRRMAGSGRSQSVRRLAGAPQHRVATGYPGDTDPAGGFTTRGELTRTERSGGRQPRRGGRGRGRRERGLSHDVRKSIARRMQSAVERSLARELRRRPAPPVAPVAPVGPRQAPAAAAQIPIPVYPREVVKGKEKGGDKINVKLVSKAIINEKTRRKPATNVKKLRKEYNKLRRATLKIIRSGKTEQYKAGNEKIKKLPVKKRKAAREKLRKKLKLKEIKLIGRLPKSAGLVGKDIRRAMTRVKRIRW